MDSQDVLGRYKKAYGVVVNWARKKRDDSGRSSKKASHSPMDIGNVGGQTHWNTGQTNGWDQGATAWNPGGAQNQMGQRNGMDGGIYSVKGKEKGKGKQQYGYGYSGYRGGGKGKGGGKYGRREEKGKGKGKGSYNTAIFSHLSVDRKFS